MRDRRAIPNLYSYQTVILDETTNPPSCLSRPGAGCPLDGLEVTVGVDIASTCQFNKCPSSSSRHPLKFGLLCASVGAHRVETVHGFRRRVADLPLCGSVPAAAAPLCCQRQPRIWHLLCLPTNEQLNVVLRNSFVINCCSTNCRHADAVFRRIAKVTLQLLKPNTGWTKKNWTIFKSV